MRLFSFLLLLSLQMIGNSSNYCFEGIYNDDGEKRFFLISNFLPYNPSIYALSNDQRVAGKCQKWWPKGPFFSDSPLLFPPKHIPCDLFWVDSDGEELQILQEYLREGTDAKIIYTTTHFFQEGAYYKELNALLKEKGYHLLAHWYWENAHGHAIYIRNDLFGAIKRSLYSPPSIEPFFIPSSIPLQSFFKKAEKITSNHSFKSIDFIYMINLDERPEKFARSSINLQLYGINPYRFSAVNGWKIPFAAFEHLGVVFPEGTLQDTLLGSTYVQEDGEEYRSNELLKVNGSAYFCLGMSRGAIGIVLSHLSILQDAYDEGYKTIWVMEDDIDVVDNPSQIPLLLQKLDLLDPDWDIFLRIQIQKTILGSAFLAGRSPLVLISLPTTITPFWSAFIQYAMKSPALACAMARIH